MPRHCKRKLFVHIGPAKTGSTSIQQMLHRLSASLEQVGVHVAPASAVYGGHGQLVPSARQINALSDSLDDRWRALFNELRRCGAPRTIVSSEHFSSPWGRMPSVKRLVALAQAVPVEVEVIACVRPQWQWLEASWTERVWSMMALPSFEEWLDTGLCDERLDYAPLFAPWKDAFGHVTVIPMESSRLPNGLLARFLEVLGVNDGRIVAAATQLPRLNQRRGAKSLEVQRLVSIALHRHGLIRWQRLQAAKRLGGLFELFDDDPSFAGLTSEQIGSITNRFASRNARFARDFEVDAHGILFRDRPSDRFVRPTSAAWDDLSENERMRVQEVVRRRLGLELPEGDIVLSNTRNPNGGLTFAEVTATLSGPRRNRLCGWLRAMLIIGNYILRGVGQTRFSARGVLILRWLRWQTNSVVRLAWRAAGR